MRRVLVLSLVAAFAALAGAPPAGAAPATRTEVREVFSPDGSIDRARVKLPAAEAPAPSLAVAAAQVVPIEINGPSASHFDLVFVGDGYTSSQLGTYGEHVRSKFAEIFATEPFKSHRAQFNVWQVNVVSQQSGVDNDPTDGVRRNTALDMYFWCGGIERLLCLNETKAKQYASAAGDVDQVIALGNTTKYGGAGGGVATAAGGNASAGQIAIHELGHSIGGLADEYGGSTGCYPNGEPAELNSSRYPAATMKRYQTKWWRWLGQASPDGGVVDTYEGASYYDRCVYRPTSNSIMRTLGRQFNLPSREAMVLAFYRETGVVAASSPPGADLWVRPVGDLPVTWRVDGAPAGSGRSLRPAPGAHTVTATVTDPTPEVRDEAARARWMTRTITWTVSA